MDIGAKVRYFREKSNISGKALAEKANLVPSQIYKIESNVAKPSIDSLERICSALGITLSEFFADESSEISSDLYYLLKTAKELTPEQRLALQHFLKTILS